VYEYTWDIVKFAVGAQIFLGIAAAYVLQRWRHSGSAVLSTFALVCIPVLTLCSATFLAGVFLGQWHTGVPREFVAAPDRLDHNQAACADWLRRNAPPQELVYCPPEAATGYLQAAGIAATAVPALNYPQFGVNSSEVTSRQRVVDTKSARLEDFLRHGITWFVIEPSDPTMARNAQTWEREGRVKLRASFADVRVFSATEPRTR
jgi:hypothetical protein